MRPTDIISVRIPLVIPTGVDFGQLSFGLDRRTGDLLFDQGVYGAFCRANGLDPGEWMVRPRALKILLLWYRQHLEAGGQADSEMEPFYAMACYVNQNGIGSAQELDEHLASDDRWLRMGRLAGGAALYEAGDRRIKVAGGATMPDFVRFGDVDLAAVRQAIGAVAHSPLVCSVVLCEDSFAWDADGACDVGVSQAHLVFHGHDADWVDVSLVIRCEQSPGSVRVDVTDQIHALLQTDDAERSLSPQKFWAECHNEVTGNEKGLWVRCENLARLRRVATMIERDMDLHRADTGRDYLFADQANAPCVLSFFCAGEDGDWQVSLVCSLPGEAGGYCADVTRQVRALLEGAPAAGLSH